MSSSDTHEESPMPITWKVIAIRYPEFVQWLTQRFGPLPDGPVDHDTYEKYRELYGEAMQSGG